MLSVMILLLIILDIALLATVLIVVKRSPLQNWQVDLPDSDQGLTQGGRSTTPIPDHLDVKV